jgi:hypothetical protein
MNRPLLLLLAVTLAAARAVAQDVIECVDGSTRKGQVVGADDKFFRLRIPPPMPGQPSATVTVSRADVDRIIFGPEADLEVLRQDPSIGRTAAARVAWQKREPFLSIPESRAAEAGLLYAQILLLSTDARRHEEALELARRIEKDAWNDADRERGTRSRLEAMLKLGRIDEASQEAQAIAEAAEDPELLLETKLLLAQTRIAALRQLLEDNPRWNEDPPVRAERDSLLNDALDLALYTFLFHGTAHEQAAEGLWLAREAYLLAGDDKSARDVATDIATIYPQTRRAGPAGEALKQPKPES